MPRNLRPERANEIITYLQQIKKWQTVQQLADHFEWAHGSKTMINRSLPILDRAGMLEFDTSRYPHMIRYKPGAKWNVFPPFPLMEVATKETSTIREVINHRLQSTNKWTIPETSLPVYLWICAVAGLAETEQEHIASYNEFLDDLMNTLRSYFHAYLIAGAIKAMAPRDRDPSKYGIQLKKDEPELVDFTQIARSNREDILNALKNLKIQSHSQSPQ